ncbi:proline dehydrogenase family protein [Natronorubrum texcoconense]|uniref:proline dehydrogenase n=1 Tax=Natronorubrum texcoconense TaxID=1095776 RepID=A0A1G8T4Y7_9EURY|nr:proline dehydrogenase family protein [Natronorubrum texcoconense]SDJ36035.1 L-proline dehydrogenase [Natronorubrum texcoconense]
MLPPIASNFVAAEDPSGALSHVETLNGDGISGILNLLGEHYDDPSAAAADADAYVDLIEAIDDANLDCCVSVKPSQIGLDIGDDVFQTHLERIVDAGVEHDVFVWIDMEDYTTTDVTLDAFERHAHETDGNVGVCVQANLKRTREDVERLADVPGKVRFVKGAYDEPSSVAYKQKARVNEAYRELLAFAFEAFDDGIAVGSHDPEIVEYVEGLSEAHDTPFEFQLLMGVREGAQHDLAAEYEVYQYVPYGGKWFSYFYRRVRERKENALFALRAVVGS